MKPDVCIVWFRNDLRLEDNTALHKAAVLGLKILPVYIWDPESEQPWSPGETSKAWLFQSLAKLKSALQTIGSDLHCFQGDSLDILTKLAAKSQASHLYWNRRYEPAGTSSDTIVKQTLSQQGISVQSFPGNLLLEPWEIKTKTQTPFKVFTPFWKAHRHAARPLTLQPTPDKLTLPGIDVSGMDIPELDLSPAMRTFGDFNPGEASAKQTLDSFLNEDIIDGYHDQRNRPDIVGTSRLSTHLHFGEISVRRIAKEVQDRSTSSAPLDPTFMSEIGWREFAYHLLFHFPHTTQTPLNPRFASFPWEKDDHRLECWKMGLTGIPIVDAGMRELKATGWMHNRVRMITASFLTKNLLQPWQEGAKYFWERLSDADLAANTLGWQWVAGCGADAAPYFRIFNPVLQSQKFDPKGHYIRTWIPELANFTNKEVHTPWHSGEKLLACGYPEKIVSLIDSRNRALDAYQKTQ